MAKSWIAPSHGVFDKMSGCSRSPSVRLQPQEVDRIKQTVAIFDPDAVVFLFGSRANPDARGGDIDLLIESSRVDARGQRDLCAKLFDQLGEQKVDIFVTRDYSEPFARIAKKRGVRL